MAWSVTLKGSTRPFARPVYLGKGFLVVLPEILRPDKMPLRESLGSQPQDGEREPLLPKVSAKRETLACAGPLLDAN